MSELEPRPQECPDCGEPVKVDAQGRAVCFECGHFVMGVAVGTMRKLPKGKDIQLPLIKNGWGLWHD